MQPFLIPVVKHSIIKTIMDIEIIKSNLCWYDPRNTESIMDESDKEEMNKDSKECTCDNCFYGRHELANELLEFLNNPVMGSFDENGDVNF